MLQKRSEQRERDPTLSARRFNIVLLRARSEQREKSSNPLYRYFRTVLLQAKLDQGEKINNLEFQGCFAPGKVGVGAMRVELQLIVQRVLGLF